MLVTVRYRENPAVHMTAGFSRYDLFFFELLRRGYSEEAIYKILGGNVLRVFEEAERVASTLRP